MTIKILICRDSYSRILRFLFEGKNPIHARFIVENESHSDSGSYSSWILIDVIFLIKNPHYRTVHNLRGTSTSNVTSVYTTLQNYEVDNDRHYVKLVHTDSMRHIIGV